MLDSSLIPLSPLLLEDFLHLPHSVFDHGGRDSCELSGDVRVATERVFARPKFSDRIERQDIANIDVLESRDGDQVAGSEDELPAGERGADVVRGL